VEKRLAIALYGNSPAWTEVLGQLGVPSLSVTSLDDLNLYAGVVIAAPCCAAERGLINAYIEKGGIVIDTAPHHEPLRGTRAYSGYAGTVTPRPLPFSFEQVLDIYSKVKKKKEAPYLERILEITPHGLGIYSFFGLDLDSLYSDARPVLLRFPAHAPHAPYERVSRVSKGTLSRFVFQYLKHLFCRTGLPFVHSWFYPDHKDSVFLFRIDNDFATEEQTRNWFPLIQDYDIKATWFVHTRAQKRYLNIFSELTNNEIAVHGHLHKTYTKEHYNEANMRAAKGILEQSGFTPRGGCAPYGIWNEGLCRSFLRTGFIYSSEFSYCYDSLPLHTMTNDRSYPILQIPVHPVCIGTLLGAKADEEELSEYFLRTASEKLSHLAPLIFYDHLLHTKYQAVRTFFNSIRSLPVAHQTFLEYAQWWKKRLANSAIPSLNTNKSIIFNSDSIGSHTGIAIWQSETNYSVLDPKPHISMDDLPARTRNRTYQPRHDVSLLKQRRLRHIHFRVLKQSLIQFFLRRSRI